MVRQLVLAITEVFVAIAVAILGDFPDKNHGPDFSAIFPPFSPVFPAFPRFSPVFPGFPQFSPVFLSFPRFSSEIHRNDGFKGMGRSFSTQRRRSAEKGFSIFDLRF
jgi:hypothetical protein